MRAAPCWVPRVFVDFVLPARGVLSISVRQNSSGADSSARPLRASQAEKHQDRLVHPQDVAGLEPPDASSELVPGNGRDLVDHQRARLAQAVLVTGLDPDSK